MAELSDVQLEQVLGWAAAGGTPVSIRRRICDDNRDGAGLAPWPQLSEHDLAQVIGANEGRRLALCGQRLLSRTGFGGLTTRASQAAAAADRLLELDRDIELCRAQFERLLHAGAFDLSPFISEERLDDLNTVYSQTFGDAIRNKDGSKAVILVREGGVRYRLETSGVVVGNELLRRAIAIGRHLVSLQTVRAKEAEILARVTGYANSREPLPEVRVGLG